MMRRTRSLLSPGESGVFGVCAGCGETSVELEEESPWNFLLAGLGVTGALRFAGVVVLVLDTIVRCRI